jgi:hypothetical protein
VGLTFSVPVAKRTIGKFGSKSLGLGFLGRGMWRKGGAAGFYEILASDTNARMG